MVSSVDQAKRSLVTLLKALAVTYVVTLVLTRDSDDAMIRSAFRKVSRKAHPDHGGSTTDQQRLNDAYGAWQDAKKNAKQGPGPRKQRKDVMQAWKPARDDNRKKLFRFQSSAVFLTYQSIKGLDQWRGLLDFIRANMRQWKVVHWCATLETNMDGTYHVHVMLQFRRAGDRSAQDFTFEHLLPNAQANDILGEGWGGRKIQQSIDRGFFYCWAAKKGTVRDESGALCVDGNYFPAWTQAKLRYMVRSEWAQRLWQAYKLETDVYEEYLYRSRDGITGKKRNLDMYKSWEEENQLREEIAARTKDLRSDPEVYQEFGDVPEVKPWLETFKEKRLRYPVLLVHAPSDTGKTEWASSLFANPLVLKVGILKQFPEKMRNFDRKQHDAVILDDVRDLQFLADHQEKIQGKYSDLIEFASTPGGQCAFFKDLYRVPLVATINNSTANLHFLSCHDFLSKKSNIHLLSFATKPGEQPPRTN